ncbi:MAG: sigma-70 family RNA polymerase sigma factor [Acidimicrobiia bacterium]|nr:sigma-70 family RNA polymerase sigma factor [Acidimicrobiia bacterium]
MIESENEQRFTDLFRTNHRAVLAFFLRRLDRDDAYDATADVFVVAWRRLADVPDGEEGLRWLYGVARLVLLNHRRTTRRGTRLLAKLTRFGAAEPTAPETLVVQQAEDREIVSAMLTLRPQDQEILRLAYWEQLPHAEIGELVGCSRKTADVRVHRALRRLRQAFEQAGHRPDERHIGGTVSREEQGTW